MKLTNHQISNIWYKIDLGGGLSVVNIDVSKEYNLSQEENNLNVYCIDADFNIVWRIDATLSHFPDDYFVSLKREGGILKARRYDGFEFEVDEKTGVAKTTGWHK